jgi:small GTP-binding protein
MNQELKILIVGNVGAGKTSLIQRYVGNPFQEHYKATIGVDFQVKGNVTLWDIAGQERFGAMTTVYYRGADGAVVVIDWTNPESVNIAERWIADLKSKLDIPILLVANKCDLQHRISLEDVETIRGVIGCFVTSAKTGEGIDNAMKMLLAKIHRKQGEREEFIQLQKDKEDAFCC